VGQFTNAKYTFNQEVSGWLAITLAWNRIWQTTGNGNNYQSDDQFYNPTFNNLDLYLIEKDNNNYSQAVGKSTTLDDNLEHIFVQVPPGEYEIVVQGTINDQDFGLAWWAGELSTPAQPGDLNGDGAVNGRDFLDWQRGYSPNPLSASDLADWQNNYGTGALGAATAVPEPSCLALLLGLVFLRRNRK
jgi:hypothetical protein